MENANRITHPDDPERCQGVTNGGQCQLRRVEGSDKCIMHGGRTAQSNLNEEVKRSYLAAMWRSEVGQFADSPEIKQLYQEIGILRMMLYRMINSCITPNDLLLRSTSISDLVIKVTKCVEACDRIDTKMGLLLDKNQLSIFGQSVITLVSNFITDPEVLAKFAEALVQEIKKAGTPIPDRMSKDLAYRG